MLREVQEGTAWKGEGRCACVLSEFTLAGKGEQRQQRERSENLATRKIVSIQRKRNGALELFFAGSRPRRAAGGAPPAARAMPHAAHATPELELL